MKNVRSKLAGLTAIGLAATVAAAPATAGAQAPTGMIPKEKISFQLYNFLIPVFGAFPLGDGTFFPPGGTPNNPEQQKTAVLNVFDQMGTLRCRAASLSRAIDCASSRVSSAASSRSCASANRKGDCRFVPAFCTPLFMR